MPVEPRRILIVGAGPTGLTAAIELARRGVEVRIIDRDDGPTPLSKAVGVAAHTLDLLEPSGVTERLLAHGLRMRGAEMRYRGERLGEIRFKGLRHRFNFLLSLPQSETEAHMIEVLKGLGGAVEWGTALGDLAIVGDRAEVRLTRDSQSEAATFDIVFGADGAESRVRLGAGIAFEGYTHRRIWSIADAEIPDWPHAPDLAQAHLSPGGDVGFIIPIGQGRYRAVSNTPDALAHTPGDGTPSRILRTDTFHLPIRQAAVYRQGPVFLGGDAAHVHSPVGARGMNMGVEDAACFARRLTEDALDGYEVERRPIARRWIALSERLLAGAQARNPLVIGVRNTAMRIFGAVPALQGPAIRRVSGLVE